MNSDIHKDFNFRRLCSLLRGLPQERQEVFLKELDKADREAFKSEEVAEMLGISAFTVRKWLRDGRIKGRKIGRTWFVPKAEIERLMTIEE